MIGPTLRAVTISETGRARVAFAVAASEASEYARRLVAEVAEPQPFGELIRQVRLLRVADLTLLDRAVIVERLAGASWDSIAQALGLPRDETIRRHAETCWLWASALPEEPATSGEFAVGTVDDADLARTADAVDAWFARTAAPWDAPVDAPLARVVGA